VGHCRPLYPHFPQKTGYSWPQIRSQEAKKGQKGQKTTGKKNLGEASFSETQIKENLFLEESEETSEETEEI